MCARDNAKTAEDANTIADAMIARLPRDCTVLVVEEHVIRTLGQPWPKKPVTIEDVLG